MERSNVRMSQASFIIKQKVSNLLSFISVVYLKSVFEDRDFASLSRVKGPAQDNRPLMSKTPPLSRLKASAQGNRPLMSETP